MIVRMNINKGHRITSNDVRFVPTNVTNSRNETNKTIFLGLPSFNLNPSSRNRYKHLLHVFLCFLAIYKNNLKPPSGSGRGQILLKKHPFRYRSLVPFVRSTHSLVFSFDARDRHTEISLRLPRTRVQVLLKENLGYYRDSFASESYTAHSVPRREGAW